MTNTRSNSDEPDPPSVEQREYVRDLRLNVADEHGVNMSESDWDKDQPANDPYKNCEKNKCNHDLVQGVLVADLVGELNGPYHTDTTLHIGRR